MFLGFFFGKTPKMPGLRNDKIFAGGYGWNIMLEGNSIHGEKRGPWVKWGEKDTFQKKPKFL